MPSITRSKSGTPATCANPNGGFYKAADAHLLDTTLLDIEAALRAAIAIVDGTMARKAGLISL